MSTVSLLYSGSGTPTTITIAPQGVAPSTTWVAGVESDQIDNTSNLYIDALVSGIWTCGTTPTTNTQVRVYVYSSLVSLATTNRDVIDGVSSAETLSSEGVRDSFMRPGGVGYVDSATSDRGYPIGPFSVAALFGGVLPPFWGLFISHNSVVNANSTSGNHVWQFVGIKNTVV